MKIISFIQTVSLALLPVLAMGDQLPRHPNDHDAHNTGLKDLSEQEIAARKKNWSRIRHVKANVLGLRRINAERRTKGLAEISENTAVPSGEDTLSAIDDGTPTNTGTSLAATPTFVDNSKLPSFPPIRSQGSIGSCATFAAGYYQLTHNTGLVRGWTNNNTVDSTKFSPKFIYNMINFGQDGGSYFSDVYYILQNHGAPFWSQLPYDGFDYKSWDTNAADWRSAISYRTNAAQSVLSVSTDAGLAQVKQLLNNGYVLVMGTYINSWVYTTIKNDPTTANDDAAVGQQVAVWQDGANGGHGMTIVGYNDDIWVDVNNNGVIDAGEKGAFKIANSWGSWWGNAGFMWVSYDALKYVSGVAGGPASATRTSLLQGDQVIHLPVKPAYTPTMVAEFTVNQAKRRQMQIMVGTSGFTGTSIQTAFVPFALNFKGGDWAFDGTTTAVTGSFALDLTDALPAGNTNNRYWLQVRDGVSGSPTTTTAFKVVDTMNNIENKATFIAPVVTDYDTRLISVDYSSGGVSNALPVAVANVSSVSGATPLNVSFSGSGSYDTDGTIVSFSWDFGDGSASASGASVSHTYTKSGTFTAKLTVTDNLGATSIGQVIVVSQDGQAPLISISSPKSGTRLSGNVSVTVNTSDNVGVTKVELYVDGVLRTTSMTAPFTTTLTTKSLSKGQHTLQTKAYDAGGNMGVSLPVTISK